MTVEVATGVSRRLTPRRIDRSDPRPEAVVFSPDGRSIAFVRHVVTAGETHNQIFVTLAGGR
jgi:hypothetical protein